MNQISRVNKILCVDLDGTLIRTDLLVEGIISAIKSNPLIVFLLPLWLLRGKLFFKQKIQKLSQLEYPTLPYNEDVLDLMSKKKKEGFSIWLTTASTLVWAQKVAEHLNMFDKVLGSDNEVNLKGTSKLNAIYKHLGEFKEFEYIGDSSADIPIWQKASKKYMVKNCSFLGPNIKKKVKGIEIVSKQSCMYKIKQLIKAIRPHQWVKNILVLAPAIANQQFDLTTLVKVGLAFLSFSLAASSIYLINDIFDLTSDRKHRTKKTRPIASGFLQIQEALILSFLLFSTSISLSLLLPKLFTYVIIFYIFLTTMYTFYLKNLTLVDVFCLTSLYIVRLVAGQTAVNAPYSTWFIAFALFLFLSLAFLKRGVELKKHSSVENEPLPGRGYYSIDQQQINILGTTSGNLSVVVLAIYITNFKAANSYHQPEVLFLLCPLLLFWVARIWLQASRGQVADDPVVHTIKDRVTIVIALLAFSIIYFAL